MSHIYYIAQSLSGQEESVEQSLGAQARTILQLAACGVSFLPGFMVSVAELREDFDALFSIIQQQGIPEIEKTTGRYAGEDDRRLTLNITLLSDFLIESNPSISWQDISDQSAPGDSFTRLRQTIEILVSNYDSDLLNLSLPAAVLIQYRPVVDQDDTCLSGWFESRDRRSGQHLGATQKKKRYGYLNPVQMSVLMQSASILETWYLDLRKIHFLAVEGKIWITEQTAVTMSVHARLRLLTDLFKSGHITDKVYIKTLYPTDLNSVFHPQTDPTTTADLICVKGGTAGSMGACSGRVFFSARQLQAEYWRAKAEKRNRDVILLKENTQVADFEAIQLSSGVITSKGGYASHAPIVARYLGKPSLIYPEIEYFDDYVILGGKRIEEGQTLTFDLQENAEPLIYFGKAEIQPALPDSEDLKTLLTEARKKCLITKVRANAESRIEARLAKEFGAAGIGLCRTEHMLLEAGRLEMLRDLFLSEDEEEIARLQAWIGLQLSGDFLELFRIMDGLPVAIRLLDAPLHEFFPNIADSGRLKNQLKQTNPMLGVRGCRLGILMPELYEMQVRAILTAALQAHTEERIEVHPEVLIPFVMSHREMAIFRKGSNVVGHALRGFHTIINEMAQSSGLEKLPFAMKIGAVIEVPAAALSAAKMAHQAEIISFGTNDLTQTTLGISRDDTGFLVQLYEELNIWEGDPFQHLAEPVKQLIDFAVQAGREVRPDLVTGICGEHSASPDVIRFAVGMGLDYVSCAARSLPGAILTAAQIHLENEK